MLPSLPTILVAVAALAVVIGLILIVARCVRTGTIIPRGGNGDLRSKEILALDAARRLHLVCCGERQVLLLTGGPQDVVVGWLPPHGTEI